MDLPQSTIRFREEDLRCFSEASLDVNPLHLSEEYSRTTPAGQRVVYGILGVLACLGRIVPPEGASVASCRIEFRSPLLLGIDYGFKLTWKGDRAMAVVSDGSAILLVLRLEFTGRAPETAAADTGGVAPRTSARPLRSSDLTAGLTFEGLYAPAPEASAKLLASCRIDRARWGDALLTTLLCSSYLVGMEMPGEGATFLGFTATFTAAPYHAPSRFRLQLDSYDERYQLLTSRFSLEGHSGAYAQGELTSTLRSQRAAPAKVAAPSAGHSRFTGKTALVIGASRGLGAALALQLAAAGATVFGVYVRSRADAETLCKLAQGLPGRLVLEQGDASDLEWCAGLARRIAEEHGALDLLVCSAAPALHALRIEAACYPRIQSYLQSGFGLVGAPLSASLPLLSASGGSVLLISSTAVDDPPKVWPHYAALKAAGEALLRVAALEYPAVGYWVARPGKMKTDLVNTPLGWADAEDSDAVATRLLESLAAPSDPGVVHYCS